MNPDQLLTQAIEAQEHLNLLQDQINTVRQRRDNIITQLHTAGTTEYHIAKKLGLAPATVRAVVKRATTHKQ